jgi:hypothetical protein
MTDPVAPVPPAPAAPVAAGPKQALSLTGFILGLVGLVFSWALVFGFLASLAAIIISVLARKREPQAPSWMKIVGLIAGIVGVVISVIVLIVWIISLAYLASVGTVVSNY